jgi:hypothetical protein
MSKDISRKLSEPLNLSKEEFINKLDLQEHKPELKGRSQPITITLNRIDIELLEKLIDRATKLNRRNKSKSAIIRMALRSLENCPDIEYIKLHEKF